VKKDSPDARLKKKNHIKHFEEVLCFKIYHGLNPSMIKTDKAEKN
jgi:hypothetical protein